MTELSLIGFLTAFAAGVVSFLSPCVLPLVPGYVSFVAGSELEDLRDGTAPRLQSLTLAATFVLGFTAVFVALGASATALGNLLLSYRYELGVVAGVVIALFGLHILGLTPIRLLERDTRFHLDVAGGRTLTAFLLGLAFAFGWTPCIGPVLAAILAVAGSETSVARGALLLGVYSAGLGLPFVLAAFAMKPFIGLLKRMRSRFAAVEKTMGALLVLTGIAFLSGWMTTASFWLLETFPALGRFG